MTLRTAFQEGITSPTMLAGWGKSINVDSGRLFKAVLLGVVFFGGAMSLEGWLQFVCYAMSALSAIAVVLNFFFPTKEIQFLTACRKIANHIPTPGLLGLRQLEKEAHSLLMNSIYTVLVIEKNGAKGSEPWEMARKRVLELYNVFSAFSLLLTNNIGDYYKEAETSPELKRRLEATGNR